MVVEMDRRWWHSLARVEKDTSTVAPLAIVVVPHREVKESSSIPTFPCLSVLYSEEECSEGKEGKT